MNTSELLTQATPEELTKEIDILRKQIIDLQAQLTEAQHKFWRADQDLRDITCGILKALKALGAP
jgi:uncharacterized coiled-coil DUF342 family protein